MKKLQLTGKFLLGGVFVLLLSYNFVKADVVVTYDAGDGVVKLSDENFGHVYSKSYSNSSVDVSEYVGYKNGYTFVGWSRENDQTSDSDLVGVVNIERNTTIYAVYTDNLNAGGGNTGGGNTGGGGSLSDDTYTLTVVYKREDGYNIHINYSAQVVGGSGYFVESPYIKCYTPDKLVLSGVMPYYNHSDIVIYHYTPEAVGCNDKPITKKNQILNITASPENPDTYGWVKLMVETDDDYAGKVSFSRFQYRSSSSSSWSNISRTSSVYVTDYSSIWSDGYFNMSIDDNGEVVLKNSLKFKKSGYYKIYVKDDDGNESYVQIEVEGSNSSSSSDEIELSTNRKSPSTNQYVNLSIETDDDYTGKLNFSAKYRSSSSSNWSNISNLTSSTYFSYYSDEWKDGYYKMTSSDNGEVTLKNLVKFKKSGYYRIYVKDKEGNESYIQFNVDGSNSSSDGDLKISTSSSDIDTNVWVKLNIEADDDYTGKITFSKFQYKSTSSSSWSSISRTSSTYVSDYSDAWKDGYYKMTSSDDGEVTLKNLVKFKKSGYYRIYIEDTDGNESYVQINVDTSSSSSSSSGSDEIELSTNKKSPSTNQYVNLTIETDGDYTGKLTFSAKYRSSSSSNWSSISNLTSSTYFSYYSDEWKDGYYKMTSSDDGEVTLKNLVKFKKNGYYRIYVKDKEGNESYIQFNVGNVGDDDYENDGNYDGAKIKMSLGDKKPKVNEPVHLYIDTDGYAGGLRLSVMYRGSSTNYNWIDVNNTSSQYFSNYSSVWKNGYCSITSDDEGSKTLYNLVSFKKVGDYRIKIQDDDGNFYYNNFSVSGENGLSGGYIGDSEDYFNFVDIYRDTSDEIFKSRSCKEYKLQYLSDIDVFTSPDLQKSEYFIDKEYFKRYIDSKNPKKDGCPDNVWINTSYVDKSDRYDRFVAPNGKLYLIYIQNGRYYSNELSVVKDFSSLGEIKYYIRDRNPFINMQALVK